MNEKLKGGLIVFLGACSFGVLSTIVKFAYERGYTVGDITGTQTFWGVIILWGIYFFQKTRKGKTEVNNVEAETKQKKTPYWKLMLAGTFTGLVGIFYYNAVVRIPASIAIILLMQYLWMSILIEYVVFKKKPSRKQIIAVVIIFLGTVLAGGIFNDKLPILDFWGIALGLLAALCYSIFLMTSGRLGTEYPVFKKSALMITGSLILTWIIFPPLFFINGKFFGGLYQWGLALAVLGTVIPPVFFSYGVPKVGVSIGAILSSAELAVAVLLSYFILHENVNYTQWIGVLFIFTAICLTNLKVKSKNADKFLD